MNITVMFNTEQSVCCRVLRCVRDEKKIQILMVYIAKYDPIIHLI